MFWDHCSCIIHTLHSKCISFLTMIESFQRLPPLLPSLQLPDHRLAVNQSKHSGLACSCGQNEITHAHTHLLNSLSPGDTESIWVCGIRYIIRNDLAEAEVNTRRISSNRTETWMALKLEWWSQWICKDWALMGRQKGNTKLYGRLTV